MATPGRPRIIDLIVRDELRIRGQENWKYVVAFGQSRYGWHVALFIEQQLLAAGIPRSQIELKSLFGLSQEVELGQLGMIHTHRKLIICELPYYFDNVQRRYLTDNKDSILLYVGNDIERVEPILRGKVADMKQLFPSWIMVQEVLSQAAPFCTTVIDRRIHRVFITLFFCEGVDIHLLKQEMAKCRMDVLVYENGHGVVRVEFANNSATPGSAEVIMGNLQNPGDRASIRSRYL